MTEKGRTYMKEIRKKRAAVWADKNHFGGDNVNQL